MDDTSAKPPGSNTRWRSSRPKTFVHRPQDDFSTQRLLPPSPRGDSAELFLFSPHLVFCASGTFSGNNQRKHDSLWSNAHKQAGSPRLFRFLKPGAEGSLTHPEPARSVLQRFPPIRRRELEPSDFRPRFKRCHRQKNPPKNCLSDKTATASDRFLVSRVSSAGLAMRQFLLSRGKKETRDGS